ncbi:MAG: hypothetical protein E7231_07585 [Cellulosilyticum sp.]|nr:hypothetical protein [Cellulosilyticum sp.]
METKVCVSCKSIFYYIAGPVVCPKCRAAEEEQFKIVKEYLRENPGANLPEVSEATGVNSKLILRFLREERLEVSANSPISITCERCGKNILTGTMCNECQSEMLKTLNKMKGSFVGKEQDEVKSKMRFLDKTLNKK